MNAELSHHLGYEKHSVEGRGSGNNRNGKSRKKVQGDFGAVEIEAPRDRNGAYDPKIIPNHERCMIRVNRQVSVLIPFRQASRIEIRQAAALGRPTKNPALPTTGRVELAVHESVVRKFAVP
jgi:transposase-like protein